MTGRCPLCQQDVAAAGVLAAVPVAPERTREGYSPARLAHHWRMQHVVALVAADKSVFAHHVDRRVWYIVGSNGRWSVKTILAQTGRQYVQVSRAAAVRIDAIDHAERVRGARADGNQWAIVLTNGARFPVSRRHMADWIRNLPRVTKVAPTALPGWSSPAGRRREPLPVRAFPQSEHA